MADLIIPRQILDDIIAHAKELTPYECCGLLAGTNGVVSHLYRTKNIVAMEGAQNLSSFDSAKAAHLERLSPAERAEIAFVMDMQDFSSAKKDMRNNGLDLQVVYHSHPHDPARPSVTDIKIATDQPDINQGRFNLLEVLGDNSRGYHFFILDAYSRLSKKTTRMPLFSRILTCPLNCNQ